MISLNDKHVAILVSDGFEQSELTEPKRQLELAGVTTSIISPKKDSVRSWKDGGWSDTFNVDVELKNAKVEHYNALILPGGQINPDLLRVNEDAVDFVRDFANTGNPIAAICHGPWLLIEAGLVEEKRMTSYRSIKTDMENAGATWVDQPVVFDGGFITSRSPADLDAFCSRLLEELFNQQVERKGA